MEKYWEFSGNYWSKDRYTYEQAKILSETNTVLEKMDTVLKIAKARNAKASNLTVPAKKKGRPKKK